MKDVQVAAARPAAPQVMSELRVTAHLMTLEPGIFSVLQTPTRGADLETGLPGVRLSVAPGQATRPDSVRISGFGTDGWLDGHGDAALIRVTGAPAQVLVTIYQSRDAQDGTAPNLQVTRLLDGQGGLATRDATQPARGPAPSGPVGAAAQPAKLMEMLAHIQGRGDVGAMLGEWLGERGSKRWIEGFGIAPTTGLASKDIEYQAVLGKGWLSPWVEGGQFCGSRAMALPVLGFRARLRGDAAATHTLRYSATFVDGTEIGPVTDGEACEAESLAAMESFLIEAVPRAAAVAPAKPAAPRGAARTKPESEGKPGPEVKAAKKAKR